MQDAILMCVPVAANPSASQESGLEAKSDIRKRRATRPSCIDTCDAVR